MMKILGDNDSLTRFSGQGQKGILAGMKSAIIIWEISSFATEMHHQIDYTQNYKQIPSFLNGFNVSYNCLRLVCPVSKFLCRFQSVRYIDVPPERLSITGWVTA